MRLPEVRECLISGSYVHLLNRSVSSKPSVRTFHRAIYASFHLLSAPITRARKLVIHYVGARIKRYPRSVMHVHNISLAMSFRNLGVKRKPVTCFATLRSSAEAHNQTGDHVSRHVTLLWCLSSFSSTILSFPPTATRRRVCAVTLHTVQSIVTKSIVPRTRNKRRNHHQPMYYHTD